MPPQYADRIRTLRQQSNLSQQALGAQLGVSAVSVSKWERGQSQPDITTLTRLADIFGTTIDDLCGREPTPEEKGVEDPQPESLTVMARAFRQLTPEEQEKYLAVGKALFAHAFNDND